MSELTEHRKNLPPDRHNEVWYKGELLVSTTDGQYAEGFEDGFDRALDMLAAVTQERDALAERVAALDVDAVKQVVAQLTADIVSRRDEIQGDLEKTDLEWGDERACDAYDDAIQDITLNLPKYLADIAGPTLDADLAALRAEAEALRGALPDPDRLETLAAWFDKYDATHRRNKVPTDEYPNEVQVTLRRWARQIRAADRKRA